MSKTLILPGLNGSGPGHWQQHWAREQADAEIVEQACWARPKLSEWLARLETALQQSSGVYLVAHSLGCLLAARIAERPVAAKIRGALLVAPCDLHETERLHPGVIRFGAMPEARLPFPSLVVGSRNDPYMSTENLQRYCSAWGSELTDIGAAGHINVDSGFGPWPQGYQLFSRLENASRPSRTWRNSPAVIDTGEKNQPEYLR